MADEFGVSGKGHTLIVAVTIASGKPVLMSEMVIVDLLDPRSLSSGVPDK